MNNMMSRKDRKLAADAHRKEIITKIAKIVHETVKAGKTVQEGFLAADRWAVVQLKNKPGEKSMYQDAARAYCRLLQTEVDQCNKKGKQEAAADQPAVPEGVW